MRRDPSHPPSDPTAARAASAALGGHGSDETGQRPVRAQLAAALLLGLVLMASGLFLWRRPRLAAAAPATGAPSASASAEAVAIVGGDGGTAASRGDAGRSSPVALSEARVLACHDRGPKKTPPDACDHVVPVEHALESAITQAAACVPTDGAGGTIEYVADVSFSRHRLSLTLPRAGRSLHDRRTLHACATAVRSALHDLGLEGVDHQHARYKIAVTATYRGSQAGG